MRVEIFGEAGKHAGRALGTNALLLIALVEIKRLLEPRDQTG